MVMRGSSLTKNKKVLGIGVNDLEFPTQRSAYVDELGTAHRKWVHPIYSYWKSILTRTNDPKYHAKFPAYTDVKVCEEWKKLSEFFKWAEVRDYNSAKVLDKDILGDGTIYSPHTCCFVSERVNNFLVGSKIRKDLPLGVTWEDDRQKFKAEVAWNGKSVRLGNFKNMWEAHLVYCKKKLELSHIVVSQENVEDYIASALINKLQKKVDEAETLYQQSLIEGEIKYG